MVNTIETKKGKTKGKGLIGPNGERFDGALGIQIIKANTPASALELNHNGGDPKYGWRVKQSEFSQWVIAEYTSFWHHPNKYCYGQAGWIPAPEQNFASGGKTATPAPGSADPKDCVFGVGVTIIDVTTTVSGNTTTTVTTYSDNTTYTKIVTNNGDGSKTIKHIYPDGTVEVTTVSDVSPSSKYGRGKNENVSTRSTGRLSWREIISN